MGYFSQNNEEKYITDYFRGRTGKFIDIGAFDVEKFSNTRRLYLNGWSGILVEPAPARVAGIREHYKDEPRIEVYDFAVGVSNEPLKFYECEDAVSTSVLDHKNKWEGAGVPYNEIVVPQIHVSDFMDKYCTEDVKFISIDTEATNMEIFRAIPDWVFEKIDMFCIEHDGGILEINGRLAPFGFNPIHMNAENLIVAKDRDLLDTREAINRHSDKTTGIDDAKKEILE